ERYRGAASPILKERVREVQVVDPGRVRFVLKEPWPDFMTFYGTSASGAAWIVPKKYFEKVGEDGYRKAPIGAGPYKFVSFQPGIELVLEAFDGYWRKTPSVKRLVLRSIPDEATRAAALKRREVDIAYFLNGPHAQSRGAPPGAPPGAKAHHGRASPQVPRPGAGGPPRGGPPHPDGREPRHRPPGHQRGGVARLLGPHRQHRAATPGVRAGHPARSLRSKACQGPARRGRLSVRARRG